ncbi:MAG: S8 family serine peptidase [Cyanobacteria bacterium NC_groundwater_1444_Ag_S-0.65um_54_12]|nr:S8 family serine peptidase [Cyanobacteria bacterium NC_groundwater_1444_Ag_S-0.65um_54_12]
MENRNWLPLSLCTLVVAACATPQKFLPLYDKPLLPNAQSVVVNHEIVVRLEPGSSPGAELTETGPDTYLYRLSAGESIESAMQKLEARPEVIAASQNILFHAVEAAAAMSVPNDTLFAEQWYLRTIDAQTAWSKAKGKAVVVAVLDSGIAAGHPDLADRILAGRSFVPGSAKPVDDFGHGTHVAGLIGAIANNAFGIAGVAPDVRILPIKVLNEEGIGKLDQIVAGIRYAQAAGAQIINMSFASSLPSALQDQVISEGIQAGIVMVAAAGNEGTDAPMYPAGIPGVLAIGATDKSDKRTAFSNGGEHVKLAAPGIEIVSTIPEQLGAFGAKSGTSMATPIVAGAVATLLAMNPALTPGEIANLLHETGQPTKGFAPATTRRLDFGAAMNAAVRYLDQPRPQPSLLPVPSPEPTAATKNRLPTWGFVKPGGGVTKPELPKNDKNETPRPQPTTRGDRLPSWGFVPMH